MEKSYIIATGWWCDGTNQHAGSINNQSDDLTRSKEIFHLWHYLINKYANPVKIIITDSDSPVKPNYKAIEDERIEFIKLYRNFKHAAVCDAKLCGWTRSVLNGAFYTLMNDVDYYIYAEQDCLIHGNIIESAITNLGNADFSHGTWNHAYKTEQSFIVIKRESILKFITTYLSYPATDMEMRPELKFLKMRDNIDSKSNLVFKELPFGYGRERPIDFSNPSFYIQHANKDELIKFLKMEGKSLSDFFKTKKKEKY